jgi:hypothetical protein
MAAGGYRISTKLKEDLCEIYHYVMLIKDTINPAVSGSDQRYLKSYCKKIIALIRQYI